MSPLPAENPTVVKQMVSEPSQVSARPLYLPLWVCDWHSSALLVPLSAKIAGSTYIASILHLSNCDLTNSDTFQTSSSIPTQFIRTTQMHRALLLLLLHYSTTWRIVLNRQEPICIELFHFYKRFLILFLSLQTKSFSWRVLHKKKMMFHILIIVRYLLSFPQFLSVGAIFYLE